MPVPVPVAVTAAVAIVAAAVAVAAVAATAAAQAYADTATVAYPETAAGLGSNTRLLGGRPRHKRSTHRYLSKSCHVIRI